MESLLDEVRGEEAFPEQSSVLDVNKIWYTCPSKRWDHFDLPDHFHLAFTVAWHAVYCASLNTFSTHSLHSMNTGLINDWLLQIKACDMVVTITTFLEKSYAHRNQRNVLNSFDLICCNFPVTCLTSCSDSQYFFGSVHGPHLIASVNECVV